MNTGTPRREKPSASTISEIVLPVPVAPATRPWRLPYLAQQVDGLLALADQYVVHAGPPSEPVGSLRAMMRYRRA